MTSPQPPSHSNRSGSQKPENRTVLLGGAQADLQALIKLVPEAEQAFRESVTLRLKGALNVAKLRSSFIQAAKCFPALVTCLTPNGDCVEGAWEKLETAWFTQANSSSELELAPDLRAWLENPVPSSAEDPLSPLLRARLFEVNEQEHVIVLTSHHLVCDRIGLFEFLKAWGRAYVAGPVQPAPAPARRPDPAPSATDAELAAWVERFPDGFPILELPLDRVRPPRFEYRGDRYPRVWTAIKSEEVLQKVSALGVDPKVFFLGLFQQFLHRITRQELLVVGVEDLTSRRSYLDVSSRNALLVRSRSTVGQSGRDMLKATERELREVELLPEIPFSQLLRKLNVSSDLSRPPVFSAGFAYESELSDQIFQGLRAQQETLFDRHPFGRARVDFDLSVRLGNDGALQFYWSFNSQVLTRPTIERWAGHFETFLQGLLENPDAEVMRVALLTQDERRLILEEWNATARPFPKSLRLHEWFEQQVQRTPDAAALVAGETVLSYRALDAQASAVARRLQQDGPLRGARVGLFLNRNPFAISGMLAVLKAGGVYVPLDPDYPADRVAFMLSDADVRWVLTETSLVDSMPPHRGEVLILDQVELATETHTALEAVPGSESDVAYLIYTSGSTGQPKGVVLEHRNVVAFVAWALEVFKPEQLSGVLCSTSFCFDLSVFEIFVPLCSGGTVILGDTGLRVPPLPKGVRMTLINTSPSIVALALRNGFIPDSVETINLAGELLRTELVDQLYQLPTVRQVYDLYGPTEDTTYSTFTLRKAGQPPSIGRPISNTQVYLLDRFMQPVPIGVAGELHLGGAGLARGYWRRPELTDERFVPNPFAPGGRLYRTGDLARYRPDGQLEYLGRVDHQLKVNGVRIEPGEIESQLLRFDGVIDAVVIARGETDRGRRLVGYLAAKPNASITAESVRAELRKVLPLHLVPSDIVVLTGLPRTPSGKLDRSALPSPPSETMQGVLPTSSQRLPVTSTEKVMLRLWMEALNLHHLGLEDDFFALGGHSLVAIQLTRKIQETFGGKWSVRSLFECPTIHSLAGRVDEEIAAGRASADSPSS